MRQYFIVYRRSDNLSFILALRMGLENVLRVLERSEISDHLQGKELLR
jgi:hypothetical protein